MKKYSDPEKFDLLADAMKSKFEKTEKGNYAHRGMIYNYHYSEDDGVITISDPIWGFPRIIFKRGFDPYIMNIEGKRKQSTIINVFHKVVDILELHQEVKSFEDLENHLKGE